MVTAEGQLRQHVLFLCKFLSPAAVINYIQGWFTGEAAIKDPQPVMQPLTRVNDVDLGVCPYPATALVCLVPPHRGAQDDDVGKALFVVALQKVESEDSLATPHCPA